MKKIIITIIAALIIGFTLGLFSLNKFNSVVSAFNVSQDKDVFAIQVGAYSSYENAKKISDKLSGIIEEDGTVYRVYVGIAKDEETLTLLKKYFQNKSVDYYLKPIKVSKEFEETLAYYETILANSNEDTYNQILLNLLKEYEKEI